MSNESIDNAVKAIAEIKSIVEKVILSQKTTSKAVHSTLCELALAVVKSANSLDTIKSNMEIVEGDVIRADTLAIFNAINCAPAKAPAPVPVPAPAPAKAPVPVLNLKADDKTDVNQVVVVQHGISYSNMAKKPPSVDDLERHRIYIEKNKRDAKVAINNARNAFNNRNSAEYLVREAVPGLKPQEIVFEFIEYCHSWRVPSIAFEDEQDSNLVFCHMKYTDHVFVLTIKNQEYYISDIENGKALFVLNQNHKLERYMINNQQQYYVEGKIPNKNCPRPSILK